MTIGIRSTVALLILLLVSACTENPAGNRRYILTTATSGGTYYPVGVAIATLTKVKGLGFTDAYFVSR